MGGVDPADIVASSRRLLPFKFERAHVAIGSFELKMQTAVEINVPRPAVQGYQQLGHFPYHPQTMQTVRPVSSEHSTSLGYALTAPGDPLQTTSPSKLLPPNGRFPLKWVRFGRGFIVGFVDRNGFVGSASQKAKSSLVKGRS